MKRIILAGGSGFVGGQLASLFRKQGDDVVVLTRRPRVRADGVQEVAWDGATFGGWEKFVDGADAVVNLTGKSINCVFTAENRRQILESRVNSVQAVTKAIRRAARPPQVFIQASAVGYYGDTHEPVDESARPGRGFLGQTCQAWETALDADKLSGTRCVTLRLGVVLGSSGGALPSLIRLTRCFLGGAAGDGRQYISWVHQHDLFRIVMAALENEGWRGIYNVTAPNPSTNAEFMRELRRVLHRPWSPPAPAFLVRWFAPWMGVDSSLALGSQRVLPKRLLESGFQFEFSELSSALAAILNGRG